MKDELCRIQTPRLQTLIQLLKSKSILTDEYGDEIVPSNKELAESLNIKVYKCNSMLKKIRDKLYEDFGIRPLKIHGVFRIIMWIPHDEKEGKNEEYISANTTFTKLVLPVAPRIGESIDLSFLNEEKYSRGTVYDIMHEIDGFTQEVVVYVHLFQNMYEYWQKLKEWLFRSDRATLFG